MVALNWMKGNRLSFFSIPGFKSEIYEDMTKLCREGERFGYTKHDIRMFELLLEKLEPLEGM
jgi:hypothetical protein